MGSSEKKVIGAVYRARLQSGLSGLCVRGPEEKHDECEGWGVYPTRSMEVRARGGVGKGRRALALTKSESSGSPDGGSSSSLMCPWYPNAWPQRRHRPGTLAA